MKQQGIIDEFRDKDIKKTAPLFELFVLRLLQEHLKEDEIKIEEFEDKHRFFDGVIKEGFQYLSGSTAIEIKYYPSGIKSAFDSFLKRTVSEIQNHNEINSLFLIVSCRLKKEQRLRIGDILEGLEFLMWDKRDLERLSSKHSEFVSKLIPNLSKELFNTVVKKNLSKTPAEREEKKNEYIEDLKRAYDSDELVLMLGAGVSQDAGVPEWDKLLSELLVTMLEKKLQDEVVDLNNPERKAIIEKIKNSKKNSPLQLARYIRTAMEESFVKNLKKTIYKEVSKEENEKSELLESIGELCDPPRNRVGIRSVVTYNFDDLLEKKLDDLDVNYLPICEETESPSQEKLGVYHVHGYLPREKKFDKLKDRLLVFSEEGYHSLQQDPYSWSNIIQVNNLREKTCLLIGLSVTDPNLRRLLSIASRNSEEADHYIILKKPNYQVAGSDKSRIRENILDDFATVDRSIKETSFKELGLNVIWVDKYDEVSEVLKSIKE